MMFSEKPAAPHAASQRLSVLVVDADPQAGELMRNQLAALERAGKGIRVGKVRVAASPDAAALEMRRQPADLLFVNVQVSDNAGIDLIRTFKRRWPRTQAVAVSRVKRSELCLEAWRAGASDLLTSPVQVEELKRALGTLDARRAEVDRLSQRNERLRVVCRRLNKARHEIGQQVDLLCNDLVRAYQELAQQLNVTQVAADFAGAVKNEIEIEGILRRTMEWVLAKLGPVNAAVYLPNGEDHFSLGAYLNLDTHADAGLIEALSQTVVQQARGSKLISFETNRSLDDMFGDDGRPLLGRSWHAIGCSTPKECLAVLVVFRKNGEGDAAPSEASVDGTAKGLLEAIAPILAEHLEEALGLYQRLNPPEEFDAGEDE